MTIKQRKIIVFLLKQYQNIVEKRKQQELNTFFKDFFTRAELIDILENSYFNEDLAEHKIETLENTDLLELIGDDDFLLNYIIEKIEHGITATPTLSEKEKNDFFRSRNIEMHYLFEKPTDTWDEYDRTNYYSLLWKHGKTKRVFAIFTSDVDEEHKYAVSTKPSFIFDTKEEAEVELEIIIKKRKFKRDELKIMSLWQIV